MKSQELIGLRLPSTRATVDKGRVRTFRRVVGSPGSNDDTAPLTYLFALEMLESDRPLAFVEDLGVDLGSVLHSEQSFEYHHPVHVGDELSFDSEVADVFEKKNGALLFVIQKTAVTRADGVAVADLTRTLVVRNGGNN